MLQDAILKEVVQMGAKGFDGILDARSCMPSFLASSLNREKNYNCQHTGSSGCLNPASVPLALAYRG